MKKNRGVLERGWEVMKIRVFTRLLIQVATRFQIWFYLENIILLNVIRKTTSYRSRYNCFYKMDTLSLKYKLQGIQIIKKFKEFGQLMLIPGLVVKTIQGAQQSSGFKRSKQYITKVYHILYFLSMLESRSRDLGLCRGSRNRSMSQ